MNLEGSLTSVLGGVVAGADVGGLVGVQGHRLVVVVVVGVVDVHLGAAAQGCDISCGRASVSPVRDGGLNRLGSPALLKRGGPECLKCPRWPFQAPESPTCAQVTSAVASVTSAVSP